MKVTLFFSVRALLALDIKNFLFFLPSFWRLLLSISFEANKLGLSLK